MFKEKFSSVFKEGTSYRPFFLCILITALAYGLYKGMLDNFLVEVVQMGRIRWGQELRVSKGMYYKGK